MEGICIFCNQQAFFNCKDMTKQLSDGSCLHKNLPFLKEAILLLQ